MYFFDIEEFSNFNPKNINKFVDCWDKYYKFSVKKINSTELIDYFYELNVGTDLTRGNVRKLLRWKDKRHLTHKKLSDPGKGSLNPKVNKILTKLDEINKFRNSEITSDEFKKVTKTLFKSGIVYEIFIFHICKPEIYPIADQHIFRAFSCQTDCKLAEGWAKYEAYRKYFNSLYKGLRNPFKKDKLLRNRKRLDNALMMFGQFFNVYSIKPNLEDQCSVKP